MRLELVIIWIIDAQQVLGHLARVLVAVKPKYRLEQLSHLIRRLVPHRSAQVDHGRGIGHVLYHWLAGLVQVRVLDEVVEAVPVEHHVLVDERRLVVGHAEDSLVLGHSLQLGEPDVRGDPEVGEPEDQEAYGDGGEAGGHGDCVQVEVPAEEAVVEAELAEVVGEAGEEEEAEGERGGEREWEREAEFLHEELAGDSTGVEADLRKGKSGQFFYFFEILEFSAFSNKQKKYICKRFEIKIFLSNNSNRPKGGLCVL